MEDILYKNLIVIIGVMFAAIVGGFFSFLSLINSKETKISEFRQDWINSLRNSIAQYISSIYYLSTLYELYQQQNKEEKISRFEMSKGIENTYSKINTSYNDILFRINDSETNEKAKMINTQFLNALEITRDFYNKGKYIEAKEKCNEVRSFTKPLLKSEWNRVKSGEPSYRYSKYFAIIILILGFSLFCFISYKIFIVYLK